MKRMIKLAPLIILVALVFGCSGCTYNVKPPDEPWYKSIKDWSPEQRASFFMEFWKEQKKNYDRLNAVTDKSDELLQHLEAQWKLIEGSRIPIRTYAKIVKAGGIPSLELEEEIIEALTELELLMLQKSKGGS